MAKYTSNFTGLEIDQGIGKAFEDVGDAYFDSTNNQQYLFKSTDDKLAWLSGDTTIEYKTCAFEFSGTINKMTVVNYMDSKNLYYTQMSESAVITVGFKSEEKGITDTSWNEVIEDARITVEIDRGVTGKYDTIVSEQLVLNGNTLSVDIFKYLATGNSRVRVTAVGVDTGSTANIVYTVLLTSMYLAPANFKWNVPFIEGQTYSLGGLYIGGAIDKILKIKVSNKQTYSKLYEINIGTQTHTSIAYYYNGLSFPTEGTGIYTVEMWLDANGLESEHLHYNIMCVAATDIRTAQLIAVSDVLATVKNYDTNKLFSYAVYNGGAVTANPIVNVSAIINNTPTHIVTNETLVGVATGVINDYTVDLAIETQEYNIQLYSSIEIGDSKQEAIYAIDNSASYPAISGAVFHLNPANRNNTQGNKETIVNESNVAKIPVEYSATWQSVSFTDGMDGWTTDNFGRKCLRLPAGSSVEIDYAPLANATTRTLEFSYRVENTADYSEDIISIATNLTQQFVGVRIKPTNVLLHSDLLRTDDLMQGYNTKDEELVHLLITVIQNYKQIGNLAQIYVNGVKKCSFEWSTSDTFAHNGKLKFGSNTADLYVYKTRVYVEAFDWIMAAQNFISCLPNEKVGDKSLKQITYEKLHSVINDGNQIDFDKIKNGGLNYFTLRLPNGANLPSILNQSSVEHTRLEINIQQNPSFVVNGVYDDEKTEGQGTTAMNYFRWNLRWKTDTIRITAKKNFASSMHSHKMGATALFNDLNRMIVGANEADARVAVEQYGVYGFLEVLKEGSTDQYNYIPIGLYTIGQDKGDKATFGYNNKTYKSTLIHLEGTDHSPKAVGMDYPWAKLSVATNTDGDANLGVRNADGSVVAAWEIGACGSAESDAEMFNYLTQEFKPAYDCDYRNTSMLVGLEKGTTIEDVNANLSAFRATETDLGYTNADCLIWIDGEYDTYYYDVLQNKYVKDGLNLLTDLGITASDLVSTTVSEKNNEIRALRMARYRAEMEDYWHLRDNLFHYCFIVLFAATDNFKKNTYPYKFGTLESGSRWRWRQDDLDTLFDINNQGLANKIYSLMNGDKSGTTHLFRGNTSYHWTNIQFYYENEIKSMMLEILTAMASLSNTGDSLIEKAVGCVRKYFWDKAQDYFTKSAYNLDAEWSYEEAWAAMKTGTYNAPVHPLQQLLGSHYEAERAFVELRFIFMASLYGFGAFGVGNDSDTSLGQISFRPAQGDNTFGLTPAINMNPTILVGDSDKKSADGRLLAGETAEITVSTDGDTSIYIQGADYLSDIGDFSKINLYAENPALTIQSKRLQTLKVGDENAENVTTVLKTLNVLSCPSLSEVDARNVSTLTGSIDLSMCPRLKKALFGGSNAGEIVLPRGSKITEFELPDSITNISLINLPNLTEEGLSYGDLTALSYLRVENNPNIQGFALLKATFEDGAPLTNIRVIGFDYDGNSSDVQLLAKLASGGYFGINEDGSRNPNIIPVIEGTINVAGSIYEDDAKIIEAKYGAGLVLNVTGGYYIEFEDAAFQELVADTYGDGTGVTQEQLDRVTSINISNNTTVSYLNDLYKFTNLKSLNASYSDVIEINLPTSFTAVTANGFRDMPNLQKLIISSEKVTSIYHWAITGNKQLYDLVIPDSVKYIDGQSLIDNPFKRMVFGSGLETCGTDANTFRGHTNESVYIDSVKHWMKIAFSQTPLTSLSTLYLGQIEAVRDPEKGNQIDHYKWDKLEQERVKVTLPMVNEALKDVTEIKNNACRNMTQLEGELDIPEGITSIGANAIAGCSGIDSIRIAKTVTYLGEGAFNECGIKKLYISDLSAWCNNITFKSNPLYFARNLYLNNEFVENLVIPSDVTDIKNGLFQNCNMTKVIIPDNTITIGKSAFKNCSSLANVVIGNSVTTLDDEVFKDCRKANFVIPANNEITTIKTFAFHNCETFTNACILPKIETIGQQAFQSTKIKLIRLGENCTSIGVNAFANWGGILICEAVEPPTYSATVDAISSIYVPDASVEDYKRANGWILHADKIKPLSEYVES